MPCVAILFDLDDTLIPFTDINRQAVVAACELAVSLDTSIGDSVCLAANFERSFFATPFAPPGGGISEEDHRISVWAHAMNIVDKTNNLPRQVHNKWCAERLRLCKFSKDVTNLLKELKSQGYKLAIITNGPKDIQRPKLTECDAQAFFGYNVVVSGEQPKQKPDASIFETALDLLGVEASEAIMVGDSLSADVQGGINAGLLGTVWVQGQKQLPPGSPQPTCGIENVTQLTSVMHNFA